VKFTFRIAVTEPEENRLLGFCGHRQGSKNEMDFVETGFVDVIWICLVVGSLHLRVFVNA